jgi:hypothetical protein
MPPGLTSFYGEPIDLWAPIDAASARYSERIDHWLTPIARLNPDVTLVTYFSSDGILVHLPFLRTLAAIRGCIASLQWLEAPDVGPLAIVPKIAWSIQEALSAGLARAPAFRLSVCAN